MEYSYSINCNTPKLIKEIKTLDIVGFVGVYTVGQDVKVVFENGLGTEDKSNLDNLVVNHSNLDQEAYVASKIVRAKEFGQKIIVEFGTRNVLAGLTTPQIAQVMSKLSDLVTALSTGSLNVAVAAIDAIEPDELLSVELISQYRVKIVEFLDTL